jgi:hypothetical protein
LVGDRHRIAADGIKEVKTGGAPEVGIFAAVQVFSANQLRGSSAFRRIGGIPVL